MNALMEYALPRTAPPQTRATKPSVTAKAAAMKRPTNAAMTTTAPLPAITRKTQAVLQDTVVLPQKMKSSHAPVTRNPAATRPATTAAAWAWRRPACVQIPARSPAMAFLIRMPRAPAVPRTAPALLAAASLRRLAPQTMTKIVAAINAACGPVKTILAVRIPAPT